MLPTVSLFMADAKASSADAASPASPATFGKSALGNIKVGWKGLKSAVKAASAPVAPGDVESPETASTDSLGSSAKSVEDNVAAGLGSIASWAKSAQKAVAAQIKYDEVPQTERTEGGTDVEKGDAVGQLMSWGKAAAQKAQQQLAESAEVAHRGLEKAKSVEFAEKAQGWGSEVSTAFGGIAAQAGTAGSLISDKTKAAQQKAKELQAKSSEKLGDVKSKAADKAKAAAGAAKDKMSAAGGSLSGMAALATSPAKLAKFGGVFMIGMFLISMSFSFLPLLPVAPQKFSLLFAFGSGTVMGSFAILKGPQAYASELVAREKLPFSGAYIVSLMGTIVSTIILKSYPLTAVFGVLQFFSLLYFLASYVPGGKAALNAVGKLCSKACGKMITRG